jgi:hypothetical protein
MTQAVYTMHYMHTTYEMVELIDVQSTKLYTLSTSLHMLKKFLTLA